MRFIFLKGAEVYNSVLSLEAYAFGFGKTLRDCCGDKWQCPHCHCGAQLLALITCISLSHTAMAFAWCDHHIHSDISHTNKRKETFTFLLSLKWTFYLMRIGSDFLIVDHISHATRKSTVFQIPNEQTQGNIYLFYFGHIQFIKHGHMVLPDLFF